MKVEDNQSMVAVTPMGKVVDIQRMLLLTPRKVRMFGHSFLIRTTQASTDSEIFDASCVQVHGCEKSMMLNTV